MMARQSCALLICMLLLAGMPFPPASGVYLGPRVRVDIGSSSLDAGASTVVYVTVYNETGVKVAGARVDVEAELGSFDRVSAVTGSQGVANFVYTAPRDIPEARSVRINATAVYDIPPYTTGFVTVWVRTVARLGIDGPDQVLAGGGNVRYIIRAVNGSSPIAGATIFVEAPALGEVVDQQRITNDAGMGWFDYSPPASRTGELVLSVRVQPETGAPIVGSKAIHVVSEIRNLTVSVSTDKDPLPCWGSCNLTAIVMKGGEPVPNATVKWLAAKGWRSASGALTDAGGRARIIYTASNSSGSLWAGPVTVQVTATKGSDTARADLTFQVAPYTVGWTAGLAYSSTGGQLLPGERLAVDLSLRLPHGRPWEFITPVSVDLRLWTGTGTEVYNRTVGQGLSIAPGLDWSAGPLELLTVPVSPTVFQYRWQVRVISESGGFVYYELPEPVQVRVLARDGGWTFLEFISDDNNLAPYINRYIDNMETGGPAGQFRYLIERSGTRGTTYRYELNRDSEAGTDLTLLSTLGELDMGSPDTLLDFLVWGATLAPAENYCIILLDHGGGWDGVCWDYYNSPKSHISVSGLEQCLQGFRSHARKPQILVFQACLMSSAEVVYRLADDTGYILASETIIWSDSLLLTPEGLRRFQSRYPPIPEQACRDLMEGFRESDHRNYPMGVLRLDRAGPFFNSLDEMCSRLLGNWTALGPLVKGNTYHVPYPDPNWAVADLKILLNRIREMVMSHPGSDGHRGVVAAIDDVIGRLDGLFLDRHLEGDFALLGYGALNIFFCRDSEKYSRLRDEYLPNAFPPGFGWIRLLEAMHPGPPQDFIPIQTYPGVEGLVRAPLAGAGINASDADADGLIDTAIVDVQVNNTANNIGVNVIIDLTPYNGSLAPEPSNLAVRRVLPVPAGENLTRFLELTSPVEDLVSIVLTVTAPDGTVVSRRVLDELMMGATPRGGRPPSLEMNASAREVLSGRQVELGAGASDPDGDGLSVWWDLDLSDGLGLDASGPSAPVSFRGSGPRTVTCIASDGSQVVVRQLELNVTPDPDNRMPSASLSSRLAGPNTAVLDASGSSDPDGDPLEYLFLFGDGNSTGWTRSPAVSRDYPNGSYEAVVMVRDPARYNGPCALAMVNVTGEIPLPANRAPAARLAVSPPLPAAGKPVTADASASSDPDNDTLMYRFDWGDGNSTGWSASAVASHTYRTAGRYNITLHTRDPGNLTASATLSIDVKPPPRTIAVKGFLPALGAPLAIAALAAALPLASGCRSRLRAQP